jgi:hypothetical protein
MTNLSDIKTILSSCHEMINQVGPIQLYYNDKRFFPIYCDKCDCTCSANDSDDDGYNEKTHRTSCQKHIFKIFRDTCYHYPTYKPVFIGQKNQSITLTDILDAIDKIIDIFEEHYPDNNLCCEFITFHKNSNLPRATIYFV